MSRHHHNLRGWATARKKALTRQGYRCSECGKAGRLEVHHIIDLRPRRRWARTRQSHGNVSLLPYRDPQEQPGRTRVEGQAEWKAYLEGLQHAEA